MATDNFLLNYYSQDTSTSIVFSQIQNGAEQKYPWEDISNKTRMSVVIIIRKITALEEILWNYTMVR